MIKYDQNRTYVTLPKCCSQSLCSELRAIVGRDPVGDPVLQITRNAAAGIKSLPSPRNSATNLFNFEPENKPCNKDDIR